MRHRIYGRHFGRDKNQRTGLFKSLVSSLFTHGTIETSESKAKAIKGLIDKIINLSKDKNTQHLLQSFFTNISLKDRLIKEVAPKLSDRQSGYTSLVRLGARRGDRTMMVRMSLIGSEKLEPIKKEVVKEKRKASKVASEKVEKKVEVKSSKPVAAKKNKKVKK